MNAPPIPFVQKPTVSATRVRWRIVALLVALSCLSWFLRVSMSVAYTERIKDQFAISEESIGLVYSALLFVYAICMTPGGWFIDRFGTWKALTVMGFGLTLFCALTGLVGPAVEWLAGGPLGFGVTEAGLALSLFLVIRSVMGAFAAPIYPASAQVVADWVPFRQRSTANGMVQSAACVGIAATPFVFGALIDWGGWPSAFLLLAAVTGCVSLVWIAYSSNRPEEHPRVSTAELRLIHGGEPPPTPPAAKGSWLDLLRNRSLMLLTVSYAAVGYFEYLFFFWMDYYFKEKLELPDGLRRVYSAIPFLGMAVGMGLGGWLSDVMVRLLGHRWGRAAVPVAGLLGGAGFLFLGIMATEPEWIVAWLTLALGSAGAVEAPTWTTAQELGGRRGGTAAGICNTGGNAGGILSPTLTPMIKNLLGWPAAILVSGLVCVVGACLWLAVDPGERTVE